jgi:hypothetical protein
MTEGYVILLVGLANGQPSEFDGQYVVEYDPTYVEPGVPYYGGKLVTTPDLAKAKRFTDAIEATKLWRASYGTRPDGKPNRPLTAYTVEIKKV